MVKRLGWTFDVALRFVRELEDHLLPVYHVALSGSVLHRGRSSNDLDLIVFPHDTRSRSILSRPGRTREVLRDFGMTLHTSCPAQEHRHVDGWLYEGRYVEIWLPSEDRKG